MPTAEPLTAARSGLSHAASVSTRATNSSPARSRSTGLALPSTSERSAPAEKARPLPVSTMTLIVASSMSRRSAVRRSA